MQPPRSRPIGAGDRAVAPQTTYPTQHVRDWQHGEPTPQDQVIANKLARELRAENQRRQAAHIARCPKLTRTG